MKRTITLILMAMMTITMTFAQRSKGEAAVPGSVTPYPDWETYNMDGKSYNYFKGNDAIDAITVENLLGFHWKGNEIDILGDQEFYLCNVATGEYLLVGDYWGETSMTNHVGMPYKLLPGTSTRRSGWGGPLADMQSDTYWIQPRDVREARVIGRASRNDGVSGHFEHNGYLFIRHQVEYEGDKYTEHPGGFLFKFEPVTTSTGEQAYIIYTHRKTEANASGSDTRDYEYFNRDSYLMVSSVGKAATADYTKVRFKKFAGQMCGRELVHTVTLYDKTDLPAITDDATAKNTNGHKYGTYDNANGGTTFTSNGTSGVEGVTVSITNGALGAGYYSLNGESTNTHTMEIYPPLKDQGEATLTITAPEGYVITAINITGISTNGSRQFNVQTPTKTYAYINAAYNTDENDRRNYIDEPVNSLTSVDFKISTIYAAGSVENIPLCFPEFTVTLKKIGDENLTLPPGSLNYTGTDAYKNSPLGDEVAFYNSGKAFVSLEDGLAAAKADPNNLWKIVTRAQRERYRIVASDKKPVDVSSRIRNPKFNTTYVYNVKKESSQWDTEDEHWEPKNWDEHPDYGWTWYNTDRPSHTEEAHEQHVHPFDLTESDDGYWGKDKEFHKVGTGQFYRFWDVAGGQWDDGQEIAITYGQEANYVGSIYKGTANLQQTITGLREGNYIVFVRGFYAPHNMLKYTKNGETLQYDGSTMGRADDTWKDQAIARMDGSEPVWLRSYDSYLFAWSHPHSRLATKSDVDNRDASQVGELINVSDDDKVEVRRMLPSIYEGATKVADIGTMSKEAYFDGDEFQYTQVGTFDTDGKNSVVNMMRNANVFAYFNDAFFSTGGSDTYIVPKTLYGAGRFFNSTDAETHAAAQNYRIGLPVTVGADGELTIGVDHSQIKEEFEYTYNDGEGEKTITVQPSNDHEWVAFDEFELIYLGADEDEIFIVDELNGQTKLPGYTYINGYTGEPFKEGDKGKEGLWDDSLNDIYNKAINGEKSPAEPNENNTQAKDIFDSSDITNEDTEAKKIKNLLIRRTMTKDGWNSIVLPVPLTRAQVEEGFGADVAVSKLKTVQGTTLVYEAVNWTDKNAKNYLEAGQPYIIRPSINPTIDVGDKFERPTFGIKVSTTTEGVAGLYLKGGGYMRNYEIEHTMDGPIYVIENVEIVMGEVFPNLDKNEEQVAVEQWTVPTPYNQEVKVSGYEQTFILKETANYLNPDPDGLDGDEKGVPPYSYYLNKGKWRYTETGFSTSKGLFTYLQLIDKTNSQPLAMPFLDRGFYFEPVVDPNGIEDVNEDMQPDDKIEVYDLMGRKVKRTGKGIYIMNGKKVLFR